jgi:hypothetical protein
MAGVKPWKGKKKPVTVVATAVVQKSVVEPPGGLEASNPATTTKPDPIAIRLKMT